MAKRRKKRPPGEKVEVPMAAMIDVVFLLLIYFIVTYDQQKPEAHMAIFLPSPSTATTSRKPQLLEIMVYPGEYNIRGKKYPAEDLQTFLSDRAALEPDQTIIIKMSLNAREGQLVRLLDICKTAGLHELNVLTLKEGAGGRALPPPPD